MAGETTMKYNYKTRMVDELIDLTHKIALLEKVTYSENPEICKEKLEMMHKQLEHMYCYRAVLIERVYSELQ